MVHKSAKVSLWIVEEHPLAARYLLTILNKKVVRVFPGGESLQAVREQEKQPPVFILDAGARTYPAGKLPGGDHPRPWKDKHGRGFMPPAAHGRSRILFLRRCRAQPKRGDSFRQ